MRITVFRIGLAVAKTVVDQAYGSSIGARPLARPANGCCSAAGELLHRYPRAGATREALSCQRHRAGRAGSVRLELPHRLVVRTAQAAGLPGNWRDSAAVTQAFGDRWLDAGVELALWVPSYVEPGDHKLIVDALHPRLAEVTIVAERDPFGFDPRLA